MNVVLPPKLPSASTFDRLKGPANIFERDVTRQYMSHWLLQRNEMTKAVVSGLLFKAQ